MNRMLLLYVLAGLYFEMLFNLIKNEIALI